MPLRQRHQEEQSRELSVNQVHPDYQSVEASTGVAFSGGNMFVAGQAQIPEQVERWLSSNGLTEYVTVKWRDPDTGQYRCSCNCPGWSVRKKYKPRRCCHTDDMLGIKTCSKRRPPGNSSVRVQTVEEAVAIIPNFSGRLARDIMLD